MSVLNKNELGFHFYIHKPVTPPATNLISVPKTELKLAKITHDSTQYDTPHTIHEG